MDPQQDPRLQPPREGESAPPQQMGEHEGAPSLRVRAFGDARMSGIMVDSLVPPVEVAVGELRMAKRVLECLEDPDYVLGRFDREIASEKLKRRIVLLAIPAVVATILVAPQSPVATGALGVLLGYLFTQVMIPRESVRATRLARAIARASVYEAAAAMGEAPSSPSVIDSARQLWSSRVATFEGILGESEKIEEMMLARIRLGRLQIEARGDGIDPNVSLQMISREQASRISRLFATQQESLVVFGVAGFVDDEDPDKSVLDLLGRTVLKGETVEDRGRRFGAIAKALSAVAACDVTGPNM